jgi:hypothetical protein
MIEVPALELKTMLADECQSVCGDGEIAHVPAGVSDKEEMVFENGTTVEGVSGQIEGW